MPSTEREPSLDDVLRYAQELRVNRQRFLNPASSNPQYRPYDHVWVPSDDYVRYYVRKCGPAKALAQIEYRAKLSLQHLERQEEIEAARLQDERRRREMERRDAEELRGAKSLGYRINAAISELALVAEGKAQSFGDVIKGQEGGSIVPQDDGFDDVRKATNIALRTVRRLEAMVERTKRSPLKPAKVSNRDEQLRQYRGYSPEQVAVMSQGSAGLPRQIRERREELGLDPETGDALQEAA